MASRSSSFDACSTSRTQDKDSAVAISVYNLQLMLSWDCHHPLPNSAFAQMIVHPPTAAKESLETCYKRRSLLQTCAELETRTKRSRVQTWSETKMRHTGLPPIFIICGLQLIAGLPLRQPVNILGTSPGNQSELETNSKLLAKFGRSCL